MPRDSWQLWLYDLSRANFPQCTFAHLITSMFLPPPAGEALCTIDCTLAKISVEIWSKYVVPGQHNEISETQVINDTHFGHKYKQM